jgi:hypothetical protein
MYEKLLQRVKVIPAINPQAAQSAGTINGAIIDRFAPTPAQPSGVTAYTAVNDPAGIYGTAIIGAATGACTGSPSAQSLTFKVQHGALANGSDMADVPASAYVDSNGGSANAPSLTADGSSAYIGVSLEGLGRYIRVVATLAFTGGTAPTQFVGAFAALGDGNSNPVT